MSTTPSFGPCQVTKGMLNGYFVGKIFMKFLVWKTEGRSAPRINFLCHWRKMHWSAMFMHQSIKLMRRIVVKPFQNPFLFFNHFSSSFLFSLEFWHLFVGFLDLCFCALLVPNANFMKLYFQRYQVFINQSFSSKVMALGSWVPWK